MIRHWLPAALLLLPALATAQTAASKPKIVCWNDESGQRHCGDRVPPQYAKAERQRYDEQGRVIGVQQRALSAEEVAAQEKARAEAAAEKARQEEAAAYDRYLLQSYSQPEDIRNARDERLRILDGRIQLSQESVAETEKGLLDLRGRLAGPEGAAAAEKSRLEAQIHRFDQALKEGVSAVDGLRGERQTLCDRAQAELSRYLQLRSQPEARLDCPAIGALAEAGGADEASVPEGARALVNRLQTLERQFDPALLDLYAADATVTTRRKGKDGKPADTQMDIATFRKAQTSVLAGAKERNEVRSYSGGRYQLLSRGRVKYSAKRSEGPKKSVSVHLLLVPQPDQSWLIQQAIVDPR